MFGPPRREAWPARDSTRTAADARKFGEAYPDPWPSEGTTRESKAAARRSAQLAESRKPREVSRSYEPSAEHLHAGNDWVQSCFRATDDYENELTSGAPGTTLYDICNEWPDALRGGACAVKPPADKWTGGTRRIGRRDARTGVPLVFDGGKSVNPSVTEVSRESPFFKPRDAGGPWNFSDCAFESSDARARLAAQRRARATAKHSKSAFAPQLCPHAPWAGSGGQHARIPPPRVVRKR